MPKPDRVPNCRFMALKRHTKKLKIRCRPNYEEIARIAKINNTNAFKAKLKINSSSNVSISHTSLIYTNTRISCPGPPCSNDLKITENLVNTTESTTVKQITVSQTKKTLSSNKERREK